MHNFGICPRFIYYLISYRTEIFAYRCTLYIVHCQCFRQDLGGSKSGRLVFQLCLNGFFLHLRILHLRILHLRILHLRILHLRIFHLRILQLHILHLRILHLRILMCNVQRKLTNLLLNIIVHKSQLNFTCISSRYYKFMLLL